MRRVFPAILVLVALSACGSRSDERSSGGWERLAGSPLTARTSAVGVWTGHEVLFVGGTTFTCAPNASCAAPDGPPLSDGAAVDLDANTWRRVSPAPVPVLDASAAVIGGDVYLLASTDYRDGRGFLRYGVDADRWEELALPGPTEAGYRLVAAGGELVAYAALQGNPGSPDLFYELEANRWSELPAAPLTAGYDRTMVWAPPHLYLFDREAIPEPLPGRPSPTRAARLDMGSRNWERLADGMILTTGPWLVERDRLTNPLLGGADGGDVNNWGRAYPNGGVFHLTTGLWHELPDSGGGAAAVAGAVGEHGALYLGTSGLLLDARRGQWRRMPAFPGGGRADPTVVSAGRDAVVFGGVRWGRNGGHLLDDVWIWRGS